MDRRSASAGGRPGVAAALRGGRPVARRAGVRGDGRGAGVERLVRAIAANPGRGEAERMTGFVSLLVEGVRWRVVAEARHLFADGAGLRRPESAAVKHGPHRTVCRLVRPGLDVFWKQCRLANLRAWLRDLF